MDLSVVIPTFNEEDRIQSTLDQAASHFEAMGLSFEIIVADDGSKDRTAELARAFSGPGADVRVLDLPHRGKGAAVTAGVMAAKGDLILMTDADLSTPLREYERLAAKLEKGADLAVGSRQASGANVTKHQPPVRHWLGRFFGLLVSRALGIGVRDSQCGFKLFKRDSGKELFTDLLTDGWCFDVEVLLRAGRMGLKVAEVPVEWENDPDSRVNIFGDLPKVAGELGVILRHYGLFGGRGR